MSFAVLRIEPQRQFLQNVNVKGVHKDALVSIVLPPVHSPPNFPIFAKIFIS